MTWIRRAAWLTWAAYIAWAVWPSLRAWRREPVRYGFDPLRPWVRFQVSPLTEDQRLRSEAIEKGWLEGIQAEVGAFGPWVPLDSRS